MSPRIATTNVGSGGGGGGGFPQYSAHVYENLTGISVSYDVPAASMFRAKRFVAKNFAGGATKLTLRQGDTTNGLEDIVSVDIPAGASDIIFVEGLNESYISDDGLHGRFPIKASEFFADESLEIVLDAGTADLVIDGDLFTL